jgi:hypothetical protein
MAAKIILFFETTHPKRYRAEKDSKDRGYGRIQRPRGGAQRRTANQPIDFKILHKSVKTRHKSKKIPFCVSGN